MDSNEGGSSRRPVKETWKAVAGFEGFYEVSNLGRVKSIARTIVRSNGCSQTFRERIRKLSTNVNGYKAITLNRVGCYERRLVSHLVIEAFRGPRPAGKEVSHEDGDLENNTLKNLKYRTKKANVALQLKHGTRLFGERCHTSKLKADDVPELKKLVAANVRHRDIAARFGISITAVGKVAKGKNWKYA